MEPELEQRLRNTSKENLIELLDELTLRHPILLSEMAAILENLSGGSGKQDADEEVTEDWDFSGDEQVILHSIPQPALLPVDSEAYRQRIAGYAARLNQKEPA